VLAMSAVYGRPCVTNQPPTLLLEWFSAMLASSRGSGCCWNDRDDVRAWNSAGPCLNDDVRKCGVPSCYRGHLDVRTHSVAVKVCLY
jgi:hypothetical protein